MIPEQPRPVTPLGILTEILARLTVDPTITPALRAELAHAHALAGGLDPYVEQCTTPPSSALAALANATRTHDWAARQDAAVAVEQEMLSGHLEGQLLRFLVRLTGARRVLEIGMFTGYSALAMAEALPMDGSLLACELDRDVAAFARRQLAASPAAERITIRVGPAAHTLEALTHSKTSWDLIFIDADKSGYLGYLQQILDGDLLSTRGLICVDNTLLQGEPYLDGARSANGTAITAFNAAIAADDRVEQILLPVRDGLTLIQRAAR